MKEDILEQLVEDYLQSLGYFTRHNLKFRPAKEAKGYDSKKDSNHSDIDVTGIHPLKGGPEKVWVVSCESWQAGFDVARVLDGIENGKVRSGREDWKRFRELAAPRWTEAFFRRRRSNHRPGRIYLRHSGHLYQRKIPRMGTLPSFHRSTPRKSDPHSHFARSSQTSRW